GRRRPGGTPLDLLSDLLTDHTFLFPSLRLAEAAARAGARAWVYQFDCAPPSSRFKACHCMELPFVFGNAPAWKGAPMLHALEPAVFAEVPAAVRSAGAGFAPDGDPAVRAPWPPYEATSRQTMVFGPVIGPVGDPAGAAWRAGWAA